MIKRLAISTAVLAVALSGCTAAPSGPVEGSQAPAAPTAESTPTGTPKQESEFGSRAKPFPQGTAGQYDSSSMWTMTFSGTNGDAWPDVQKVNQYNEPPKSGDSDVLGTLTVSAGAGADDEGADPGDSLTVTYVGADGNSYDTINHPCGVLADTELQDAGLMYTGASRTVSVCAQVPTAAVAGGTWSVTYVDGSTATAFFAGA